MFQFHHQPLNYYASFAPDTPGRTHLRDEVEFQNLVAASNRRCQLNSVSFIKPIGLENEHPGYTSVNRGSDHLVDLISSIEGSACARDTMIIVTYDEFGGQWDHVPPPGQGGAPGPHDQWGPGTRIPALIVAPQLRGDFVVDHTSYDTTSVLATIEQRFGLDPVATRDAQVNSLANAFEQHGVNGDSTPVDGGVSGTVPATLSLALGAPASFGPFTPGITKTYEASTSATVTTTAGDATRHPNSRDHRPRTWPTTHASSDATPRTGPPPPSPCTPQKSPPALPDIAAHSHSSPSWDRVSRINRHSCQASTDTLSCISRSPNVGHQPK